jgi:hypothetical protein
MKTRLPYRKQRRKNYKEKLSIIRTSRDEKLIKKKIKKSSNKNNEDQI